MYDSRYHGRLTGVRNSSGRGISSPRAILGGLWLSTVLSTLSHAIETVGREAVAKGPRRSGVSSGGPGIPYGGQRRGAVVESDRGSVTERLGDSESRVCE